MWNNQQQREGQKKKSTPRAKHAECRGGSARTIGLTLQHVQTFCSHSVFVCFVWIWEQTAIISLYSINWLVCITEMECVYCAVRTGSLYIIQVMCFVWIWEQTAIISLYNINWLVFITETECVYCAVRTGSLYVILRSAHTVFICFRLDSPHIPKLVRPSDKSSIMLKMSTEHWWNDTNGKSEVLGVKPVTMPRGHSAVRRQRRTSTTKRP